MVTSYINDFRVKLNEGDVAAVHKLLEEHQDLIASLTPNETIGTLTSLIFG